ncbi:hypothetical protein [Halopiger goleimassiliensis]|uniref:hypothetical protein n=1 Tax=Halopiger goleimassiliensis TaxID=1293048 RepID=UPI0006778E71|nr:hypothetical protein [Halopiger goleimassiliensis]
MGTETGGSQSTDFVAALERLRTEPTVHLGAVLTAVGVGIGVAHVHWIGLLLGGILIGLVSPTIGRALLGAIGFGLLVLVLFAVSLGDSAAVALEATPIVYVPIVAAIGLPAFGSLVRGIV